jgi:hypothetical protein
MHDDEERLSAIVAGIRRHAKEENVRLTPHAQQEMVEESIAFDDAMDALSGCEILENYPEHRRGACGLVLGFTNEGRPLHVVCTTERPILVIITVYEPKTPKWVTPRERG